MSTHMRHGAVQMWLQCIAHAGCAIRKIQIPGQDVMKDSHTNLPPRARMAGCKKRRAAKTKQEAGN
eukprot:363049-Chlamydomonas_euryale.AAC.26